ncbi:MAG: FtsX-like permease family protein [Atopobiaceae bacterium]|nr:FtsX-like permease family protein [Atopobiaceae bacterium]
MNARQLSLKNLTHRPGRTFLLCLLVALLSAAVFASSVLVASLRGGLESLEARMGADIIVAPKEAAMKSDLSEVILEGVPKSFYMSSDVLDKVAARDGVELVSPQYYLATMKAGCCSFPVQIIGIDPETDFTIQPWIDHAYSRELGEMDVVAGANVTGAPGSQVLFYDEGCRIVSKLDETGTALDNAIFGNAATIKRLVAASKRIGNEAIGNYDPDSVISLVQVKVADGFDVQGVTDDINLHVRGVRAVRARAMTSGIADSMAAMARMVGVIAVAVCVLALVVLLVSFTMLGRQRTREFAVLRVIGASRRMLAGIVMREALVVSLVGALAGLLAAGVVVLGFSGAIEQALGLPFLMPQAAGLAAYAARALAVSLVAGPVASAASAFGLSRVDTGQILREE